MRSSFLCLFILVAGSVNAGAAERRTVIPAGFQGEWNIVKRDCGTSRNDSGLRIAGKLIQQFESRGKVLSVVTRGKRELAVILESSGEGETWLETQHYRLSANGKELTDARSEAAPVRYRCP